MTPATVRMFVLALALLVAGCASTPSAESGRLRRSANLITAEEIERASFTNLFDLVRALRPAWLQTRGPQSIQDPTAGEVVVYLDGTRLGGPEQLRMLPAADVASLQYLNGIDAPARFGRGHLGGAILIRSKTGR